MNCPRRFLGLLAILPLLANGATTNTISQFGITFTFADAEEYGRFANGDYWVVGPVTITAMTPAWDGSQNGWELNPEVGLEQGFYGLAYDYTASLRPSLPWVVDYGTVVKAQTFGQPNTYTVVSNAVALTVLTNIPPDGTGLGYFRPPYIGSYKPLIPITQLQTNLLPTFAPVGNTPSLSTLTARFSLCLRMDHSHTPTLGYARHFRPASSMENYQLDNTVDLHNAMLRLMLDDPIGDKMPLLIQFTQHALDRAFIIYNGYRTSPGSGHNPTHRIVAAWGAVLLDLNDVKTYMATAEDFHEDENLVQGGNGQVLWGNSGSGSESTYWQLLMSAGATGGARSRLDPYGYIDGGYPDPSGNGYQDNLAQALKGQALVARLLPELQGCFPADRWYNLTSYAQRWVDHGYWTLPDPVAPYDGNPDNYGITFGPNGSGGYIPGSGRFPYLNGTGADTGQARSAFVASMWTAYNGYESPATRRATLSGSGVFRNATFP